MFMFSLRFVPEKTKEIVHKRESTIIYCKSFNYMKVKVFVASVSMMDRFADHGYRCIVDSIYSIYLVARSAWIPKCLCLSPWDIEFYCVTQTQNPCNRTLCSLWSILSFFILLTSWNSKHLFSNVDHFNMIRATPSERYWTCFFWGIQSI